MLSNVEIAVTLRPLFFPFPLPDYFLQFPIGYLSKSAPSPQDDKTDLLSWHTLYLSIAVAIVACTGNKYSVQVI